jgi:hypothetical protein
MRVSKAMASLALLAFAICAERAVGAETSFIAMNEDAEYDAAFRCPEALPATEREEAARDFFAWAHRQHGDWTLAEAARYRLALLERHQCGGTLQRLRDSVVAPPPGATQAKMLSR